MCGSPRRPREDEVGPPDVLGAADADSRAAPLLAQLAAAGLATVRPHLPSSADRWTSALRETLLSHRPDAQRATVEPDPAGKAARWLEALSDSLWRPATAAAPLTHTPVPELR